MTPNDTKIKCSLQRNIIYMYRFTPIALYNMLIFSHFIFFGSLHVKSYEEKEIKVQILMIYVLSIMAWVKLSSSSIIRRTLTIITVCLLISYTLMQPLLTYRSIQNSGYVRNTSILRSATNSAVYSMYATLHECICQICSVQFRILYATMQCTQLYIFRVFSVYCTVNSILVFKGIVHPKKKKNG